MSAAMMALFILSASVIGVFSGRIFWPRDTCDGPLARMLEEAASNHNSTLTATLKDGRVVRFIRERTP